LVFRFGDGRMVRTTHVGLRQNPQSRPDERPPPNAREAQTGSGRPWEGPGRSPERACAPDRDSRA
jgi:hypothetical protein